MSDIWEPARALKSISMEFLNIFFFSNKLVQAMTILANGHEISQCLTLLELKLMLTLPWLFFEIHSRFQKWTKNFLKVKCIKICGMHQEFWNASGVLKCTKNFWNNNFFFIQLLKVKFTFSTNLCPIQTEIDFEIEFV